MSSNRLVARALSGAIVAQLTVAGVVLATGGAQSLDVAIGLERAEILDTVGLAERVPPTLRAAGASEPVELAAAPTTAPASAVPPTTVPVTPPPPPAPSTTATSAAGPPTAAAPAASPSPRPAPAPEPEPEPAAVVNRDAGCEASMLQWMNEARAGAGAAALADDPAVDHVAARWSEQMAGSGRLDHNPRFADEIFAARPEAMTAGEVVGRGPQARAIFEEFLRSPTHRDAILRPAFTRGTVGCVWDGGGQVWVTANFWG